MMVKISPAPPSAPTLMLREKPSIRSATSSMPGNMRLDTKSERRDCASSEPMLRRMVKAMAVTGTSDSAVLKASAAACCGHLSRAHCFRMRIPSRVR